MCPMPASEIAHRTYTSTGCNTQIKIERKDWENNHDKDKNYTFNSKSEPFN
jgi:hypothetical protein